MEFIKGKYLTDIARAIKNGAQLTIGRGEENPILCRCIKCHLELIGYQRHKKNQEPLIHFIDRDVYHRGDPIHLPEEQKNHEEMKTDYFGMDSGLMDGICPQCGTKMSQIWFYRFLQFPKPNLYRGHMPGSETLYLLDPTSIVKEFTRCDLRLLMLNETPIGCVLQYTNATVSHKAFGGWPEKDFQTDILAFYIDGLITRESMRSDISANATIYQDGPKQEAEDDWRDAEVVVRELDRLTSAFQDPINRKKVRRRC